MRHGRSWLMRGSIGLVSDFVGEFSEMVNRVQCSW